MVQKRPWFYLLRETLREFAPIRGSRTREIGVSSPWLLPEFKRRFWFALSGYEPRITLTGIRPSLQQNRSTLEVLRRHIASTVAACPTHEKRYPYLDRDLVEFCFAIPREQLVRPGRRRFLQRNALRGIVPSEILERKRKSFVVRGPMKTIGEELKRMDARQMISASLGIVDPDSLLQYLSRVRAGEEVAIVPLMRLLTIERWLRGFAGHLQTSEKDSDIRKPANRRRSLKIAKVQLALAE
ncbi:MAG: asparagine synthase-related protein [Acidobacteriaceae bacterium]